MSLKILLITATKIEASALKMIEGIEAVSGGYRYGSVEISLLITGIGSIATAWAMMKWISENEKPHLAINAGFAGSYNENIIIGDVVMPVSDCFADSGIEDCDNFLTLAEAGLTNGNEFPYTNGIINSDDSYCQSMNNILRSVKSITVNTVTGSEYTKEKLIKKFNPDIETMEGATFFYICSREKIPFLAIRAISNLVEARNRSNWNIELALHNLSEKLKEMIIRLE